MHNTNSRKFKPSNRAAWEKFGLFDVLNYLFLGILVFLIAFPFYNSIVLAFNDGRDAISGGIYFWPRQFTLENIGTVVRDTSIYRAFFVSVARTVIGTVISILVTSTFAYSVSKSRLRFRGFYLAFVMFTMVFNGGMIPTFLLIRDLRLIDNFLVYVLPGAFSVFNALIFMSYFRGIPASLEESAYIDGASTFRTFFRIVVPVSKPVFASIILFTAVGQWNSWYDNMLYVKDDHLTTLSYVFTKMIQEQAYMQRIASSDFSYAGIQYTATTTSLQLATMVISVLPIMIVYPMLQKHFAKGIMIGSIKG